MFILLGEFSVSGNGLEAYIKRPGWGRMWARDPVKFETPHEFCGFDNGAYSFWKSGDGFDHKKFAKRLEQCGEAIKDNPRRLLFGVVPDIPAQGMKSLEFSLSYRKDLPAYMPWYLALQDGMEVRAVKHVIHNFDGLALGGTNDFKRSAKFWCDVAHYEGKAFHYLRCSTVARLREARAIRADSVDSSLPVINWNMGDKKRSKAKEWLNVAMGRDPQKSFLAPDLVQLEVDDTQ